MKSSFLYILLLSTLITTNIRAQEEEPSPESSSATLDESATTTITNSESNDELPSTESSAANKQIVSELKSSSSQNISEEIVKISNESPKADIESTTEHDNDKILQAPAPQKSSNGAIGNKYQLSNETKENIKGKFNSFKIGMRNTAKKLMDILNMDLKTLDVRNNTLFIPFYTAYQKLFNKHYKNEAESKQRMSFFKRSIEAIKQHNKDTFTKYKQGINELSDMNLAEIIKYKLGFRKDLDKNLKASAPVPPVNDLPAEWDWRKYGVVTIPRNQGKCGSCWSFAAATVLESHNMKRQIAEGKFDPKKQITVSEQNLIDCSGDYGTIGCDGGMPQQAFKYIAANKGVNGVNSYPYKGKKEKCAYNPKDNVDVSVKEGRRLKSGIDKDLATAIYNYGPVAIAIHVTKDMAAYKSGIFEDKKCSAKKVNHAVVAIGYAKDYFIIRNSWGPKWGEDGYIRVSRSIENNCGISQQGYYPVIPNAVETKDMRTRLVVVTD